MEWSKETHANVMSKWSSRKLQLFFFYCSQFKPNIINRINEYRNIEPPICQNHQFSSLVTSMGAREGRKNGLKEMAIKKGFSIFIDSSDWFIHFQNTFVVQIAEPSWHTPFWVPHFEGAFPGIHKGIFGRVQHQRGAWRTTCFFNA